MTLSDHGLAKLVMSRRHDTSDQSASDWDEAYRKAGTVPPVSDNPPAERRGGRDRSRTRGDPSPGRRRSDYDPRATVTAKVIAAIVFVAQSVYLAGEILLYGQVCP